MSFQRFKLSGLRDVDDDNDGGGCGAVCGRGELVTVPHVQALAWTCGHMFCGPAHPPLAPPCLRHYQSHFMTVLLCADAQLKAARHVHGGLLLSHTHTHTHTPNPAIIVRVQVAAATTVTTGTERVPHTHEGESVARRVNDKFANATYKCEKQAHLNCTAMQLALERPPLTCTCSPFFRPHHDCHHEPINVPFLTFAIF